MSKKQKYYVYIGQLRKEFALSNEAKSKNVNPDPNKFGLYVGSSSKPPRQRWAEHLTRTTTKKGKKNWSDKAADWGMNYIHWKKFQDFNPVNSRSEAEKLEKELAIKFSGKGYATWSDQLPYLKKDN